MSRIDVALDARQTSHMSIGMRQYARALVARLPQVAPDLTFETFEGGDNFDWEEQVKIPLRIRKLRPKLVHFLSPYVPLTVPAPYVVTIHDLIDLHYPQWTKSTARFYYRFVIRRSARGARFVITDDRRTADDIVRFYGVPRERIAVIPLGVDLGEVEPIHHERAYVIYAGNRRPHKDLRTLVQGWMRVDPSLDVDLVLTGEVDSKLPRGERARGRVIFLGPLSHEDLMRWMRGAAALVHAALVEGFGLPLLEAARLGTPVVASAAAVPDVLDGHVRTFPPGDADGLARGIEAALRHEDDARASRAREATSSLTWDRCARLTAELYRRLL